MRRAISDRCASFEKDRMPNYLSVISSAVIVLLSASTAYAQLASSCLRPLAIPDKWVENQTPPWDPTDTFDPTGENPDVYLDGFDAVVDQGTPMALTAFQAGPPTGQSALPVQTGDSGNFGFRRALAECSGYLHAIENSLPVLTGVSQGPLVQSIDELLASDPDALWDPLANGGRGGVVGSAFEQSPRLLALPVFAPGEYAALSGGTSQSMTLVKIVGFFVSGRVNATVQGYLTGWSRLSASAVTARADEFVPLSATFMGPGATVVNLPIDFFVNDSLVATALTDGTGTARPPTTSFNTGSLSPGTYPAAIRVKLAEGSGFFVADVSTADLTILPNTPNVTWSSPNAITYGTALGSTELNASADVAGTFVYTPQSGSVLHAADHVLSVRFVPADNQFEEVTATVQITVTQAPLTVGVNNASKLYLDPLPAFSWAATGFVNGDTASVLGGTPNFQTTASSSSPVGQYTVTVSGLTSPDYTVSYAPGTLTVTGRPTSTNLQQPTPSPSTYGQPVTITVIVGSDLGTPTGPVTLFDGSTSLGSTELANGQAAFTVSALSAGTHPLRAQYAGLGGFSGSVSSTLQQSVAQANTTTQLASSVNPSRTGQAVTLTATVNPVAPGGGFATGVVEFLRDSTVIGTAVLSNGIATITTSSLPAGKLQLRARYVGTPNHGGSVSGVLVQTVKNGR
jgi:hypothetical protein